MAAAENVRCNLSVEEEIHGEWMFRLNVRQYVWHVGYYFEFNISLISFSTVSKNRVCIPLKTTQPETDIAHIRYYYGIVRKSVEKKIYMNLTCVQNLLSTWFALSVYDSCDWLSAITTLPMGQIFRSLSPVIGVSLCVGHYFETVVKPFPTIFVVMYILPHMLFISATCQVN